MHARHGSNAAVRQRACAAAALPATGPTSRSTEDERFWRKEESVSSLRMALLPSTRNRQRKHHMRSEGLPAKFVSPGASAVSGNGMVFAKRKAHYRWSVPPSLIKFFK